MANHISCWDHMTKDLTLRLTPVTLGSGTGVPSTVFRGKYSGSPMQDWCMSFYDHRNNFLLLKI